MQESQKNFIHLYFLFAAYVITQINYPQLAITAALSHKSQPAADLFNGK